jgi:hypothetical protein
MSLVRDSWDGGRAEVSTRERITLGVYVYLPEWPAGCQGCRYEVLDVDVVDVPTYQEKILVLALEGPDRGLKFTVSPDNFARRYRRLEG